MNKKLSKELLDLLNDLEKLLLLPNNDFVWQSTINNTYEAQECLDKLKNKINSDNRSVIEDLLILFAPTGSLQEISISSGWSDEYMKLASRFDKIIW